MTQTSIRLTNLSSKVTDQFLKSNFSTVGQVLNVSFFFNFFSSLSNIIISLKSG
jgi:hypothetical protein